MTIEQAQALKQDLIDWVYNAEGEIAVALETFVAEYANCDRYDSKIQSIVVDTFLTQGQVGDRTPVELYSEQAKLTAAARTLLNDWQRSFTGLFEIVETLPQGFTLMNWLTAKRYTAFADNIPEDELKRLGSGEIILTRMTPISESEWMFSPCILKGKLGKPKLAVAIGEFKENYRGQLYSDAPELLEQAWDSVAQFHQEFVDFFGSDRLTLSGYELNKQLAELQQIMSHKRLAAAGIDGSKSLQEVAQEAGVDAEELTTAAAAESGESSDTVAQAVEGALSSPMVTPKIDLPPEIKNAEHVTSFSHPRWGQMFIPTYAQFVSTLTAKDDSQPINPDLVRKYLQDPTINFYIWQQLKESYHDALERALQTTLARPEFSLERDLEPLLLEYGKPSEPELPETASVPLHLHNLFEAAVAQVHKSKSKGKKKKKAKGFQ
ncbi:MAG: hypothetical protein ACFB4I_07615 [Cyanophyceae cyanobacterium]